MKNEHDHEHGPVSESHQGVIDQPRGDELAPHVGSPGATRTSHGLDAGPSGPPEQAPDVRELRSDVRAKMLLVLAAMHALPSNGRTVTASLRELQKQTGFSRGAAARAIHRCVEAGWIEPTGNRRPTLWSRAADSYRLLAPAPALPSWLWSTHGLGATTFLIFDATPTSQAAKTKEIAATAGVSVSTAQRGLRKLLSVGVVDNPKRGWWIRYADSDYLHQVAEFLTHEAKTKRIRLIREEQAEFKAFDDWCQAQARRARVGRTKRSQPGR
jgi:predicted transcriptional regulator